MAWFNKTALYLAVEKENVEIVNLLISNNETDPNIICIFSYYYIKFTLNHSITSNIKSFNGIQHYIIQLDST